MQLARNWESQSYDFKGLNLPQPHELRRGRQSADDRPAWWDYLVLRMDKRVDTRRYVLWYQRPGDQSSSLESGRSGEDSQYMVLIIFILDQARGPLAVCF